MAVKITICFIISFAIAVLFGPIYIPLLKRLKFGQTVRDNGPKTHLSKQGTPTIGGLIFMTAMLPGAVFMALRYGYTDILIMMITMFGFGVVGFLDDILKIKRKSKDGLNAKQKMALLFVIAAGFSCYMYFIRDFNTVVCIDLFATTISFDIGWGFIPLSILVLLSATNAVNLTDGLDGLCAGSSFIVFIFFMLVSMLKLDNPSIVYFSIIVAGGLLGFLIFNYKPAKVFMGDTGSLALGGAIGVCVIMLQRPFMLLLVGLLFVIEAMSVMLQVTYYKLTHGKRLFKMAPIHHHFELMGWSEKKVVTIFWIFTLVCCAIAYFAV